MFERDPACKGYMQPFLFFKGFLALQTHRVAHWLWVAGREAHGLLSAEPDVGAVPGGHPPGGRRSGRGAFFDHGTGIVIGETAVIGDDVSMLQGVTLGGTGAERGDRHPKIGSGVLLGAGAKVLGNITVGDYAKIASGSVVLSRCRPAAPRRACRRGWSTARPARSRRGPWTRPWPTAIYDYGI